MFSVKRSISTNAETPRNKQAGCTSKQLRTSKKSDRRDDGRLTSTSGLAVPGAPNSTVGTLPITVDLDNMLSGFVAESEHKYFYPVYRDMYFNDPVCGSTVDLMSVLPFSDFSLGGTTDKKALSVFEESVERLNIRTLAPEASTDYLTVGGHCSSLLYNREKRIFTDVIPHAIENTEVVPLPFYSQDPILTVTFPQAVREALQHPSKRIARLRERIGADIFNKMIEGTLELDPAATLYLPRRSFSTNGHGTSLFRRVLPYYLIEKGLYRGTLVESQKRQRGILHATLGDGDQWDPSTEELEFFTNLLNDADSDPVGAVLVTKSGVSIDEFRQGGDFWKVTDFSDSILPHKLRALGVSEGFLSGETSYNTSENALSVFIEMLRAYRDQFTRKLFYNKLFPLISVLNGFAWRNNKLVRRDFNKDMDPEDVMFALNDGSKLFIPTVHWAKQLKPEGDSQYMEMLQTMSDKGVPVPLRVMAAAGGMNLEELLRQQDDDLALRGAVAAYKKKIDAFAPKPDEGMSESSNRVVSLSNVLNPARSRSSVLAGRGRVALLNREFGDAGELKSFSATGKAHMIVNQRAENERINRKIAKSLVSIRKRAR